MNYDENINSGLSYVSKKKYSIAKKIFKESISINNDRYEAYLNLSNILVIEKNFNGAEKILKEFTNSHGYNKQIVTALAILYYNIKDYKNLEKIIDENINLEDNENLYFCKSCLCENAKDTVNQTFYLEESIKANSNFWPSYEKIFNIYEKTNKLKEFEELIMKSENFFKNNKLFFYYKSLCLFRKDQNEKALKEILVNDLEIYFKKNANLSYLINLYDLFSKIYLKLNHYKKSISYAIKRNTTTLQLEQNKKFDKTILLNIMKKYKIFYQKNKLDLKPDNANHDNLVFLVGFPRSGTTLLDSILRSHSQTLVLEEKPYLINIRHKFFNKNTLDKILSIDARTKLSLQKEYFDSFNYSKDKIIIDKFPLNIIELAFIKTIFPNSKLILALRHPLDCILSCVLTSFKINEAMANYENLETTTFFYNEVFSLFEIYKSTLNLNYYSIKYENVVKNFDYEIKNLLSYLDLNFEDSVRYYYNTAKKRSLIHTPSYHQVVKPIYTNSLNRYKKFEDTKNIQPLVKKWIKEFNY